MSQPYTCGAELGAIRLGHRLRRLRPVRQALRRVERAGLVERAGRAGVDAQAARAAIGVERRCGIELDGGDERAEHYPRSMALRDEQRVLAVEADAASCRALSVDVLVRIDEHAIRAADLTAERVELLPELRVRVPPRVAREPPMAGRPVRLGRVVTERRRNDGARARQQQLRVARLLRPRHREAHVGEEPASAALADVPLGLRVRLGGRGADGVDPELRCQLPEALGGHPDSLPRVLAVRIHEDGGPEVLVLGGGARPLARPGRGPHPAARVGPEPSGRLDPQRPAVGAEAAHPRRGRRRRRRSARRRRERLRAGTAGGDQPGRGGGRRGHPRHRRAR